MISGLIRLALETNVCRCTGAIGKDAMLENGRLNPSTNLQAGAVFVWLSHACADVTGW